MLSDSISYTSSNQDDIQRAVIMFHGYGSDGKDLISLAPSMAKKVPNAVFYSPNAPIEMEYGYKWFDLDEFAAVTVFEQFDYLEKLMERARPLLPTIFDFIQQIEQKHNLKSNQVTLMGFSQGGLLALMSGLLYKDCLSGVIGASAVPITINKAMSLDEVKNKPPVLLTHGRADDVVPFVGMQISQNTLKNIGCAVQTHAVDGMGHQIDDGCMNSIVSFINLKPMDNVLQHDNVSLHHSRERD